VTAAADPELLARLQQHGWAVIELGPRLHERLARPWSLVDGLLGMPPLLLEVQPIRAVVGGRSFASSQVDAPLHSDSQQWRARPPELQLTACLRAAASGGESLLLDGHALLETVADDDPELHAALLRVPRCMPFVFGDVYGPTAALRGGRFVLTHTPRPLDDDPIAARLAAALARMSPEVVSLRAGEALVVDNHRVLHGRIAFDDPRRELLRLLAWLDAPLGPLPSWAAIARETHAQLEQRLRCENADVRRSFGIEDRGALDLRARAVTAMLAGAPPGLLAQRLAVPEPELYRWRDAQLGGAAPGTIGPREHREAALAALAALTGRS
jgi:gamma-butyrobetaine dioxygenase